MTAAGMDISDPAKFSKAEWGLVCGLPIREFNDKQRPVITKCSAKFGSLLTASDSHCPKSDSSGTGNDGHQTVSPDKMNAALCGAVKTFVRLFANVAP